VAGRKVRGDALRSLSSAKSLRSVRGAARRERGYSESSTSARHPHDRPAIARMNVIRSFSET
jgi:hypothetical protein